VLEGEKIRTCAESIHSNSRAEERLCDPLLLLDEDAIALSEARQALNGCDTSTCKADS
jgi:hypothetical protein